MRYSPPQPKDKFPEAEIWKNKDFCKACARGKPLEDWYLERLIRENEDRIELLEKFNELKEKLEDAEDKLKQASKPLEQRVTELEKEMKRVFNGLRETRSITDMLRPLK